MKRIIKVALISTAISMISVLSAFAQEKKPYEDRTYSLAECIAYAQEHSPNTLAIKPQVESLELSYRAAKEAFLPSLNMSAGENVSFGRSQGKDFIYRDVSSANTSVQVSSDLTLFSGGSRWYQLQKTDAARGLSELIISEVKDQIALKVASSYVQWLLANEMLQTAKDNLSLTERHLSQIREQVQIGKASPAQLLEVESQLGRDQLAVVETEADLKKAKKLLLLDMGILEDSSLSFISISSEKVITNLDLLGEIKQNNDWSLPSTKKLEKELELARYDLKIAKSRYLPSLSLGAGYSNGYYHSFGNGFMGRNAPFMDQLRSNGRTYIGLSLSIPIYNRGQVRQQVKQTEIRREQLASQLIQQKYNDDRNIAIALADLEKANKQYSVSKVNTELSQKAYNIKDLEYQAGRTSTFEWEQAKNRLLQAKATYLQAVYTRLLRTINLAYLQTGSLPFHLAE